MSEQREPMYKIGDKVRLNVGGPDMAVKSISVSRSTGEFLGDYRCQWFAGKKLDSGEFPEQSLELIDNNEA